MARVLKRPMFRRGGFTNDGIMSGLVDREQKSTGDLIGRARELTPELESLLREFTPKTRLPLGAVGAALVGGVPIRDALTAGYTDFAKRDDAREAAIRGGAAKLGISQAMKEAQPNRQSVLAAEKEARFMLPENATPEQIRAKTAELLEKKYTGVTYGDKANFRRAYEDNKKTVGRGYRALNLTIFEEIISPQLRKDKKVPKDRISMKDGKYDTRRKPPGVYVDIENGKVVEITNELEAVVLDQYDDFFRQNYL
jgi:hypothetical protein